MNLSTNHSKVLIATDLWKTFPGSPAVDVLKGVSLEVNERETLAIMGNSGEGKSTLLHILGALEPADRGEIKICGTLPKQGEISSVRNQYLGFIFQAYHLLEDFTTLENVCMPLNIARKDPRSAKEIGKTLLADVGLSEKEQVLTKFLSGGEKQRVAIARALANNPSLLLADEPTGNLDRNHSQEVQNLLLQTAKNKGKTLIVVTHDEEFAHQCDRILLLKRGYLYTQRP